MAREGLLHFNHASSVDTFSESTINKSVVEKNNLLFRQKSEKKRKQKRVTESIRFKLVDTRD